MMAETLGSEHSLEAEQKAAYEKLCGGTPDALFVLARFVRKNAVTGEMQSGSYSNANPEGAIDGGKARSIAAAQLHKAFPQSIVVANSHVSNLRVSVGGETKELDVNLAEIMSKEMSMRGVEEDKMLRQEASTSTFTELLELIKLVIERNWHHVAIVANEYQIPRADAMLENIDKLHDPAGYSERSDIQEALAKFRALNDVKITFVSAEETLVATDHRYKRIVDEVRVSPLWLETVARENEGARQVRAGEYWKKTTP